MMNGILRIQTYRPRQSAPVEGVTVVITGSGFTAHRITDAEGNAEDVAICAPACALSLDENNTTTLPYQCRSKFLCLFFLLCPQALIQIPQDRHILRSGVFDKLAVDFRNTAVNDRFLNGL